MGQQVAGVRVFRVQGACVLAVEHLRVGHPPVSRENAYLRHPVPLTPFTLQSAAEAAGKTAACEASILQVASNAKFCMKRLSC